MTQELIDRLRAMYVEHGTNYVQAAADKLEAQAERIKFLEADRNLEKKMRKDADEYADQLRAQISEIAEIEKAEPVAWIDEYGNAFPLAARQYSIVGKGWRPLFTRPMPTDSKDAERYQWLRLHGYVDSFRSHSRSDKTELSMFDAAIDAAIEGAK